MALNFPVNPVDGEIYPDPPVAGSNVYRYDASYNTWRLLGVASGVAAGTYGNNVTCVEVTVTPIGVISDIINRPIPTSSIGVLGLSSPGIGLMATAGVYDLLPPFGDAIGGVKQGENVTIASNGAVSVATASTTVPGIVQLNNTLSSTSITEALTAYQGKVLQDQIDSLTVEGLVLCGVYDAATSELVYVTESGFLRGFAVGENLPAPAPALGGDFVIVSVAGTPLPPAPDQLVSAGDWIVFDGYANAWIDIPIGRNITASQVIFNPYGSIDSTNVQDALQELDDQYTNLATVFAYVDDISSEFDGIRTTFDLTVGGTPFEPSGTNLAIFVGGVFQQPGPSYTFTGSQITFSEAPLTTSTFAGIYGSPAVQDSTAGNGTVTLINTGIGLTGGPITTSGTINVQPATDFEIGGVKPDGSTIVVSADGTISLASGAAGTVLAVNTGTGLTGGPITTTGTISLAPSTNSAIGGVKPDGITTSVSPDGTISALGTNEIYPILTTQEQIARFDPLYWRVDGPLSMSFCVVPYQNGYQATFVSRSEGDLCGIIWDSEDTKDHIYTAYETNTDYRGLTWVFDVDFAPTCPVLNEPTLAPSLTVEAIVGGVPTVYYIALKNYAGPDTNLPVRQATITIDWSTVQAGFDADIPIDASNITRVFFAGISSSFVEGSTNPLPAPIEGYLRVTNMSVTGTGTTLTIDQAFVAPHEYGMSTSYDDHYDLNPARIVKNCQILGYRQWINHYCGISHYPNTFWNATAGRYLNAPAGPTPAVNIATAQWHAAFAEACKNNKYNLIFSVSYEYFSLFAYNGENGIADWIQRDWDGNPGETGYTPPSYFFSLCNTDAIAYLHQVFVEFAGIMDAAGIQINMQVGEPWWWYNPSTSLPCVYDFPTRLAFNAATGLFMQDMGTIQNAKTLTASPFPEMYSFLRTTLGESVQDCRAAVKAAFPTARVCPLIFLPTILDESSGIMNYINYPVEEYSYPNFEFIMTECYDWITTGQLNKSYEAMENPISDFGYTPDLIQYLGGFVNVAITDQNVRKGLWRLIIGNLKNNIRYNIQKQHIWAYPQVMTDSITIIDQNDTNVFYFGDELLTVIRQDPT